VSETEDSGIELSWIPQTEGVRPQNLDTPFRGIFILTFQCNHEMEDRDMIVLYRDPHYTGGGRKVTVTPENAESVSPISLPVVWRFKNAKTAVMEIPMVVRRRIEDVFAKLQKPIGYAELNTMLWKNHRSISWDRLREMAEAKGLTPHDIADLI
jgi:hypothetical protein